MLIIATGEIKNDAHGEAKFRMIENELRSFKGGDDASVDHGGDVIVVHGHDPVYMQHLLSIGAIDSFTVEVSLTESQADWIERAIENKRSIDSIELVDPGEGNVHVFRVHSKDNVAFVDDLVLAVCNTIKLAKMD